MRGGFPRTVVVLGGGVGGLTCARELARRLRGRHRVVLVERSPVQYFGGALTWVMVGYRAPGTVMRDVRKLLPAGVSLVEAPVEGLDLAGNRVFTASGPLAYDYLVLALGAEMGMEGIPGLAGSAHTYYHLDGAVRLRDALGAFQGGRVALVVPAVPYKCPAAPYDGSLLLEWHFRHRGIRERVDIQVYTVEPMPLPIAGQATCSQALSLLRTAGVGFNPGHKLARVDPQARTLHFENGREAPFDLLISVPLHRPPAVVQDSPLAGPGGWVRVERETLRTAHANVYAIGDVTAIPLAGGKGALPKAGVFAHGEAITVARHLARELTGRGEPEPFDGTGGCFLSTGIGEAAFVYGHFLAEPAPQVQLRPPSRVWHASKALSIRLWAEGRF